MSRSTIEDAQHEKLWYIDEARERAAERARATLARREQTRQVITVLQPVIALIEAHLGAEIDEAWRSGDNLRGRLVELALDELYRDLAQALREAAQ